jgi:hypothetical protein
MKPSWPVSAAASSVLFGTSITRFGVVVQKAVLDPRKGDPQIAEAAEYPLT